MSKQTITATFFVSYSEISASIKKLEELGAQSSGPDFPLLEAQSILIGLRNEMAKPSNRLKSQ